MFDVMFGFGTHICLLCTYTSPLTEGVRVADGALYEALQTASRLIHVARKVQPFSLSGRGGVLSTLIPTEEKRKHERQKGNLSFEFQGTYNKKIKQDKKM